MRIILMMMALILLITATIMSVNARTGLGDADGDCVPDALDVDADGDGMPNMYEVFKGTDPLVRDIFTDAIMGVADAAANLSDVVEIE
ncbi:hypothetical protein DRN79_02735 [Methanosarcinales archaeon]|nr:MAG: hypothetical protein DRN79_02735 [Methanosarcinales archaeon]